MDGRGSRKVKEQLQGGAIPTGFSYYSLLCGCALCLGCYTYVAVFSKSKSGTGVLASIFGYDSVSTNTWSGDSQYGRGNRSGGYSIMQVLFGRSFGSSDL